MTDSPDTLKALLELERLQCTRSLYDFFRSAWSVLEPGKPFIDSWHYRYIADLFQNDLMRFVSGAPKVNDFIINAPPRDGKSTLLSICAPAWAWIHRPGLRFLTAARTQELALDQAWNSRRLIQSDWYAGHWGGLFELSGDQNVKQFYATSAGGYRLSVTVGSDSIGRGGDIIIVDDPQNVAEAYSETARDSCERWYTNALYTRLNDQQRGTRWVIQQRLHTDDLTGRIMAKDSNKRYYRVCLPAERTSDVSPPEMVDKYENGLLFPARLSREVLSEAKLNMGSYVYNAQYNQSPVSESGNMFRRSYWRFWKPKGIELPGVSLPGPDGTQIQAIVVDAPDSYDVVVQSWDMTFKGSDGNDRCCGHTVAMSGADEYLLDEVCHEMGFVAARDAISNAYRARSDVSAVLVEDTANGPAVIEVLWGAVPCLLPRRPLGSKVSRATDGSRCMSLLATVESGHVYLPHPAIAHWVNDLIDEFAQFPNGKHDDRVDAFSQAHSYIGQSTLSSGIYTQAQYEREKNQ